MWREIKLEISFSTFFFYTFHLLHNFKSQFLFIWDMENIQIRLATNSDIPAIMELWQDLMAFHQPLNIFFELCSDAKEKFQTYLQSNIQNTEKAHIFVADGNNQIVGYMMGVIINTAPVFKISQIGEIMDAFVAIDFRRQNIGENLFNALKNWFQIKKVDRVDVNIAAGNPLSSQFWTKMGFKPLLHHLYQEI